MANFVRLYITQTAIYLTCLAAQGFHIDGVVCDGSLILDVAVVARLQYRTQPMYKSGAVAASSYL